MPFEYVIGGRNIPRDSHIRNALRCRIRSVAPRDGPSRISSKNGRSAWRSSPAVDVALSGTVKYHHPEYDFDRWIVTQFEAGNTNALLDMTVQQLDEAGNTELLAWAVLFGAIGPLPGELIHYIPTWHHGLCYMRFLPSRPHKTSVFEAARKDNGGLQFKNQGYAFYKHPPAHASNLNRLLFEIRNDAALRERCVDELDSVADEYELGPEQRKAARTFIDVGEGKKLVSDYCEPLVNAGAHPLTVLLSLRDQHNRSKKRQAAQQTKAPVQS